MEDKFNDLGVDAVTGADIMYKLGMSGEEISDSRSFEKMKDIISYIKNMPPEHRSFFISNAITGKNVDKLDHLWGYVKLNEQLDAKQKEMEMVKEQMRFYEN